jgi:hypothetical protein
MKVIHIFYEMLALAVEGTTEREIPFSGRAIEENQESS